jgi:hypothetical protein
MDAEGNNITNISITLSWRGHVWGERSADGHSNKLIGYQLENADWTDQKPVGRKTFVKRQKENM